MTETDRFSLRPRGNGSSAVAGLMLDGRELGVQVRGQRLVRQYTVTDADAYLLLLAEDNATGVALHMYLLDDAGRAVQRKTITAPAPGLLADVRTRSPQKITFVFGGQSWALVVQPKPRGLWGVFLRQRLELSQRPDTRAVDRALDEFGRTHEVVPMGGHVLRADQTETIVRVMYMTDHVPPARAWFAVPANDGPVRELSYDEVAPFERVWR